MVLSINAQGLENSFRSAKDGFTYFGCKKKDKRLNSNVKVVIFIFFKKKIKIVIFFLILREISEKSNNIANRNHQRFHNSITRQRNQQTP